MNKIIEKTENLFEDIKHINEEGGEYWSARELQKVLQYSKWENFHKVIKQAMISCENSNNMIFNHFPEIRKIIDAGVSKKKVLDYNLSRYACYLIAQNGDSRKKVIALAQTYFAFQTRKMELTEKEYSLLTEDEKRLYRRKQTRDGNRILYKIAKAKGVKNCDKSNNAGYKGLYNGETADDIAKRKGLRYREDILDNMSSAELGANIFRITQTEVLLSMQQEQSEIKANKTHYEVGKAVRETMKKIGVPMPEDLPTPKKSLKEIEKEELIKINGGCKYFA